MYVDLRQASFDEFVAFVFDHPVVERDYAPDEDGLIRYDPDAPKEWYWEDDLRVDLDPARQVALLTELFRDPSVLRWRFTPEQRDQGFWFIFGAGGEEYFTRFLAEDVVPWPARQACIEAIYDLYAGLFLDEPWGTAPFMLWDILLDRFWSGEDDELPLSRAQERPVRDTFFRTLSRILALPSPECQHAALHGLGHLRHPDTAAVVAEYLAAQPQLDPDLREYAERVRDGEDIL